VVERSDGVTRSVRVDESNDPIVACSIASRAEAIIASTVGHL
jgi:hypothetical protein